MVSSKCFADIGQTQPFVAARVFRSPPALRDQLFGKVGLCPPQSDSSRPHQRSLGVAMAGVHSGSGVGSMMPRPTRQPDHQRAGFCRPPRSPGKPAPVFTLGLGTPTSPSAALERHLTTNRENQAATPLIRPPGLGLTGSGARANNSQTDRPFEQESSNRIQNNHAAAKPPL
jgi:hypothetical protein